ncbi:TraB/GumN family protein [Pectobacteriaceae bacterium CE90]|nr:TraB/GumN family protein [Pectobacteriaceae bacterium CE90]
MRQLLRQIATFLGFISPGDYAYPAVDVQVANQRQFHLVGSIHMGTIDMSPLPVELRRQLQHASALVVEADISDQSSPFSDIESEPPLAERLDTKTDALLKKLCTELTFNYDSIEHLPAWQIALMLQARQALMLGLRPDYGIDYQLITAAREQGLEIIELEGQQAQVGLLQQLPYGGAQLLEDTLIHWHTNARLLQTMVSWWLNGKPVLTEQIPPTFGNEMSELLMNQRNRHWKQRLITLPPGQYVVAVGALHLYGDGNLPQLLQTH